MQGKLTVHMIRIGMHFQWKLFFINGKDRHHGMDGNENILSSLTSLSYCKYLTKIY